MTNRENENIGSAGSSNAGGAQPASVSLHTYVVTTVPVGCDEYSVGDTIDVYVTDPPPHTITINPGDNCNGTIATLQS